MDSNKKHYNILGAVAGDIIGSHYESSPTKSTDFELFPHDASPTDDTAMTLAVAEWLVEDASHSRASLVQYLKKWGRKFPDMPYGPMFKKWLSTDDSQPYNSYGNGSAMRVSPVGLYAKTPDEAMRLAKISAEVTHNHPEGIKGAQAVATAVFMAKEGASKTEIKSYIENTFGYDLTTPIYIIRPQHRFDASCQRSVPQAIRAYIEGNSFEEVVRLAVSLGGDADTQAAIAGSIAAATPSEKYKPSREIVQKCLSLMHPRMISGMYTFFHFLEHPVIDAPIRNSYKVDDRIYAGEYPATSNEQLGRIELQRFVDFGITHFIDLTEQGELLPYDLWLPEHCKHIRFAIMDCGTPKSMNNLTALIEEIISTLKNERSAKFYIHCRGGIGRTGTVVGCYYAYLLKEFNTAFNLLQRQFSQCPKSAFRRTPETLEQKRFIMRYADFVGKR